jgi:signal recognition particle receptor subunit beta
MVQINFAQKQVSAKIVYYGPGMSGKTTNLEVVHQRAPDQNKGELTSISTDGDRTLFFDFMPLDLGTVAGMRTSFQIYTVPGQVYYNSTRKLVLQGVDGVVFVADSSAAMLQENLESLRNLEENLNEYGKSLSTLPHVIQFNKRDMPDAMSVDELNRHLNAHGAGTFEAIANTGQGVFPTLKALAARVLESIHSGAQGGGSVPAPRAPAAPAPHAPRAPMPTATAAPAAQLRPNPVAPRHEEPPAAALPQHAAPMQQPLPVHAAQNVAYANQAQAHGMPTPQQLARTGFLTPPTPLTQTGFQQQPLAQPMQMHPGYAQPMPPQMQPQMAPQMQPQMAPQMQPQMAPQMQPQMHAPAPMAPQMPVQHGMPVHAPMHPQMAQPMAPQMQPPMAAPMPQMMQQHSAPMNMAPQAEVVAPQAYAQPAPSYAPQQPAQPLQMAPRALPSANAPRSTPTPAPKPAAAPQPAAPRNTNGPLEGTRFRPRAQPTGAPRAEARPTPAPKSSSKLYVGMFVAAAAILAVGLTYVVISFL